MRGVVNAVGIGAIKSQVFQLMVRELIGHMKPRVDRIILYFESFNSNEYLIPSVLTKSGKVETIRLSSIHFKHVNEYYFNLIDLKLGTVKSYEVFAANERASVIRLSRFLDINTRKGELPTYSVVIGSSYLRVYRVSREDVCGDVIKVRCG